MSTATPTTAAAVANEFLALRDADPGYPPITPMKLQKLVFYAHAWYLATHDDPLFAEDIEAWPWGPVVRGLYRDFVSFGRSEITGAKASEMGKVGSSPFDFSITYPAGVPDEIKPFIKQVWDVHKKFTGVQLSNSTHAPNEPWTIVKENYGSLDSKPIIPNELIKEVFAQKLSNAAR